MIPTLLAVPLEDNTTFVHSVRYITIILMVRYTYNGEVIEIQYVRKF